MKARDLGLRPGFDPDRVNQLVDELQVAETRKTYRPQSGILHPGERHADILFGLLESLGTAGSLTTDAYPAALAIEHQAALHFTDADFSRFAGLKWRNPIGK